MKSIRNYNPDRLVSSPYSSALAVSLLCCALWWWQPGFRYEAKAASAGLWWAAVAGQFAHLSANHLWVNLAGLWIIAWGFKPWIKATALLVGLASGCAGVWIGLWLHPAVIWYAGLSGALHGLMVYALCKVILGRGIGAASKQWAGLIALGLLIKLTLEVYIPGLLTDPASIGGPVLPQAHQWGALGGLAAGLLQWLTTNGLHSPDSRPE